MLGELIRMCLISSVFKPIKIEGRDIPIRSQINLCIEAPFGTGKTYILETIRQKDLGYIMDRWTDNAFYGTINRAGQIIPPATILGAGKTIMIDEFQSVPIKLKLPLLKLLEEQRVNRQLLNKVAEPVELERDFYSLKAVEGFLELRVQASYVICTSKIYDNNHMDKMLLSRCIVVSLDFTVDDVYTGLCKLNLDDVSELREKLVGYSGRYSSKEDKAFLDLVVQEITASGIPHNYVYRIRDDLIRIDNYVRALESIGYDYKYDYEDFLPIIVAGIKRVKLRPSELETYATLPDLDSYHRQFVDELVRKGLVRRVNGNYIRCCNFAEI